VRQQAPDAFPREHTDTLDKLNTNRRAYEAGEGADPAKGGVPFDDIPPAE